jgi:hypothetical protein
VRCIDGASLGWYPRHHRAVDLAHGRGEGAKGAVADDEGHKDVRGFQFKVFALCYITSFDEVLRFCMQPRALGLNGAALCAEHLPSAAFPQQ